MALFLELDSHSNCLANEVFQTGQNPCYILLTIFLVLLFSTFSWIGLCVLANGFLLICKFEWNKFTAWAMVQLTFLLDVGIFHRRVDLRVKKIFVAKSFCCSYV
uniref:Uncharacterized protein n=1 Tax=Odontella aurita TaxID=265563 RepID=A0A6U6JAZ7_9STRA